MVSLRDVARAAGVSPATASRALARPDRVSADRRTRVERAAADLGYQPGRGTAARSRQGGHSRGAVGLVVPDMQSPFFAVIAKGIQRRARAAGLSVVVADAEEDPRLEAEILEHMAPQVIGIVLCSARMSDQALAALPADPEIVLVNRESEHLRSVIIDAVVSRRPRTRCPSSRSSSSATSPPSSAVAWQPPTWSPPAVPQP